MKPIYKIALVFVLLILATSLSSDLYAQCPMCRLTAESNLANGGVDGKGLNRGILFLLATPYLLIGFIAYNWWKNRKSEEEIELEQ